MHKDMVFFHIETGFLEGGQEKIREFAALRIHDGQVQKSCFFQEHPKIEINNDDYDELSQNDRTCAISLSGKRGEILDVLKEAVLISHQGTFNLQILEKTINSYLVNDYWDTYELARIFFPMMQDYQLSYLAEYLSLGNDEEEDLQLAERKAYLTWRVFEACKDKGRQYDLSFLIKLRYFWRGGLGRVFLMIYGERLEPNFPSGEYRPTWCLLPRRKGYLLKFKLPIVKYRIL